MTTQENTVKLSEPVVNRAMTPPVTPHPTQPDPTHTQIQVTLSQKRVRPLEILNKYRLITRVPSKPNKSNPYLWNPPQSLGWIAVKIFIHQGEVSEIFDLLICVQFP